ncbi:dienelactone hydrolase family protein [Alicyclobacillus tolerans]|uniref:dienelactone hydrolase family protein n=1 Tax=Alicyclobacillus tolerans TaxID=90970 RepID=UPI001F36B9D9|nr:dienelactone hydrolase family protein [Alicyclobacillus tolerans]MCF8568483.1 dienelactone hydrolase family protein [Alicyclobacillus tolerans]
MSLHTEWVRYGTDNVYSGYFAKPERVQGPLPAILVIQEIWGVDEHIQEITRRFAQAGYVAFAPDLYAVNGQRPAALEAQQIEAVKAFLDTLPPSAWGNPAERDAAVAALPSPQRENVGATLSTLFGGLKMSNYMGQLTATSSFLRGEFAETRSRGVASVGFCMGGALSALLASSDPALSGAVVFYGSSPSPEQVANIACPVLGFYGERDTRITSTVPELAENMQKAGKSFESVVYQGANHAFFNDTRASYHVAAARDAFARTLEFFTRVLSRTSAANQVHVE